MNARIAIPLLAAALAFHASAAGPVKGQQKPSQQTSSPAASQSDDGNVPANLPPAERAARKLKWISVNGARQQPNMTPTTLTEDEINAYVASSAIKLPKGVHQVRFTGENGNVTADATINFDEIREGQSSANPLLLIFSGTHQVQVTATAGGTAGKGNVHVQTVELDGVAVPRMALEFFVEKYLKPKYPNLGLDSTFALPARIDTAVVGQHALILVQK